MCEIATFSRFQVYLNVTRARQTINLLLVDNFYPVTSYRRVRKKKKATNCRVRVGSLVMVRETSCKRLIPVRVPLPPGSVCASRSVETECKLAPLSSRAEGNIGNNNRQEARAVSRSKHEQEWKRSFERSSVILPAIKPGSNFSIARE